MIQRIQNLYLLLALILILIATYIRINFFIDLSHQGNFYQLVFVDFIFDIFLIIFLLLILITVFNFKNLNQQKKLLQFLLFISVLFSIYMLSIKFYFLQKYQFPTLSAFDYFKVLTLPFLLLMLNYLAFKGVKKDINLLSSADRLR